MADDGILHCVVVVRGRPTPGKRADSEAGWFEDCGCSDAPPHVVDNDRARQ